MVKSENRKPEKKSVIRKAAAAAATAAILVFSPMVDRPAHAQDSQPAASQPAAAQPAERSGEAPREESSPSEEAAPEGEGGAAPTKTDRLTLEMRPRIRAEDVLEELDESSRDPQLLSYPQEVDISGRLRTMTLNNSWDLGANVIANEAGSSIAGTARYVLRRGKTLRPLELRLDAGNIWFGEHAAPFTRFKLTAGLDLRWFRMRYYGSAAALAYMPSVLYTSHSIGAGLSIPFSRNTRLRIGGVTGGALSYPAWDDIYFNITTGASLEVFDFLIYAMPQFYFAAPDPIKTAYLAHYRPEFQNIEFGVQYRFLEDQYTVRAFGDYGRINHRVGARITRTIDFSDTIAGDIWIAGGATHWDEALGGRWDPLVMLGMNIIVGGEHINSTNTVRYEHLQSGGIRFAETDIPTQDDPGPYGFGRSGDPEVDAVINTAKERMLSSSSFEEFSSMYGGAPQDEVILTARFLGAFLQQAAYANDAYESLSGLDLFTPEVARISNATVQQIYYNLRQQVAFYQTHHPNDPLPDRLQDQLALCAGIAHVQAVYMRTNGIPSIVVSVNTPNGPHMVPIAMTDGATELLNYGQRFTTPEGTFDQNMRFFGQYIGAPTFQSQLFGPEGYMGTYITSEGRLLHITIGIDNMDVLARDFLGVVR